jgi:tetratricopeptide (TPR) repeat protein
MTLHLTRSLGTKTAVVALLLATLTISACSRDPRQFLDRGKTYLGDKKYNEAVIEFKNAVKTDPRFADGHYHLALAYLCLSQYESAYQSLLQTVALDANNMGAQLRLGNLLLLERKFDEARAKAELVLNREPQNVLAQILLGDSIAGMIQINDSIAELRQGLEFQPRLLPSYLNLRAAGDTGQEQQLAEEAFRKAIELDSRSIPARLSLANFLFLSQRFDEAAAGVKAALEIDPQSRDANQTQAFFFMQQKNLPAAEQVFIKLERIYSKEPSQSLMLGDFYSVTGKRNQAIAVYEKIQAENPDYTTAKKRLANLYLTPPTLDKAMQLAEEILKKDPKDGDALLIKGRILLSQNKRDDALKTLEGAVKAQPASAWAITSSA